MNRCFIIVLGFGLLLGLQVFEIVFAYPVGCGFEGTALEELTLGDLLENWDDDINNNSATVDD